MRPVSATAVTTVTGVITDTASLSVTAFPGARPIAAVTRSSLDPFT